MAGYNNKSDNMMSVV